MKARRLRISRSALKRRMAPALMTFVLVSILVFMPAYRFEASDPRLTRLELAQMFETVLESCRVAAQPDALPEYSDLNDEQLFGVYRTLSCGIMSGYPDSKFKPCEFLRNIETVGYLQKLVLFLRQVKPESDVGRQLVRLMAYQDSPAEAMSGKLSSFMPEQLNEPSGFTDREVMAELVAAFIGQLHPKSLEGHIINAVTGRPLARAFVASEKVATVTDKLGFFRIEYPVAGLEEVAIMAVAENFQPVELKKNIKFNQNIVLRLKPAKSGK
jgi:hypothetical protein